MSGYVPEDPLMLAPGVGEMLNDPAHFSYSGMLVVDYGDDQPEPGPEPLPSLASPAEPRPRSRWQRLIAPLTGRKP
jgi:hypothetical protein